MDPFSIVSAGLGTLSNAFTNLFNAKAADDSNQTQLLLQQRNNEFNHNEAELSFERQKELWNLQNAYNNPVEQVRRLQQAGLNPALLYGSMQNSASSASSASMASSASSGVSPQLPHLTPVFSGAEFANIAKALSDAKKTGAEGDEIINSLQDRLRKMKADADMADMAATFERIYGGAMRDKSLQKTCTEVQLLTEQVFNLKKQGKLTEAETKLTEIKQLTESMDARMKKYQGDTEKLRSETYVEALNAELNLKSAQASAATASAALSREEAETVKALRISEVELNEARVRYTNKQISFTSEQIRHSATDRRRLSNECISIIEDIKGKRMDNEEKSKMLAVLDKQIELDLRQQENFADQQEQDYWNPFRIIGSLLGGAGGAVAVQGMRQNAGKSVVVRGFVP